MWDINTVIKEFKFGGIERIFVCFYSYFIVGYLILFVIYENSFINLQLSTQIFLAIAISFPITSLPAALYVNKLDTRTDVGFFYMGTAYFYQASIYYTIIFSIFYLLKHLEMITYNAKLDPFIGVALILSYIIYVEKK
jgi:hypothetical protein